MESEAGAMLGIEIPPANSLRLSEILASLRETDVRHWILTGKQVSRRDAKILKDRKKNSPAVSRSPTLHSHLISQKRFD